MATKYLLQNFEGETLKTGSKKQALVNTAEKESHLAYRVVTEAGTVVHEVDNRPATPTENPISEQPEPVADEVVDAAAEVLYYEQMDFPGNYSIVTAPGAVEIAEAAGVPAKVENHGMALTRTVHFGGPDMDKTQKVVEVIREETAAALAHLKAWQKDNIERRRGLTDMQRYLEHRTVLAEHFTKVARNIRKNGLA